MSRKHYIAIANIIRGNVEAVSNGSDSDECHDILETVANELADFLKTDNANFDRSRFLSACGVQ